MLLCLTASLFAAPSCKDVDTQDLNDCISLSRRWYQLQDEIYLKTCPSLQPSAVGYDSCMEIVNRSATERLTSEVEAEDNGNITDRAALNASPLRSAAGKPIRMHFEKKTPWWRFW